MLINDYPETYMNGNSTIEPVQGLDRKTHKRTRAIDAKAAANNLSITVWVIVGEAEVEAQIQKELVKRVLDAAGVHRGFKQSEQQVHQASIRSNIIT